MLAHSLNLQHASHGTGDQRQVHIMKVSHGPNISPPHHGSSGTVLGVDGARNRQLNRAATTDFGEARQQELAAAYNGLRGQSSVGLLSGLEPTTALGTSANLRSAKSFADLRSYTPSPAPSLTNFPPIISTSGSRNQQDGTGSGSTSAVTPNSKMTQDDRQLSNGVGNLSLGTAIGNPGSPRRVRNMFSWDEAQTSYSANAPIGSNRTVGARFEDGSSRQPRGPGSERSGFRRQNGHHGRGSDELRNNPAIIVE